MKPYSMVQICQAFVPKDPEKAFQKKLKNLKYRKKINRINTDCWLYIVKNRHRKKMVRSNDFDFQSYKFLDYIPCSDEDLIEIYNQIHGTKVRPIDIEKFRLL